MTDLAMWSLIVGFFLPPIVAVLQQPRFSERLRAVITFVTCLVAGGGTAYFQGDLTGRRFVSAVLLVFVMAIVAFKGIWKPTGAAPAIEEKTS